MKIAMVSVNGFLGGNGNGAQKTKLLWKNLKFLKDLFFYKILNFFLEFLVSRYDIKDII